MFNNIYFKFNLNLCLIDYDLNSICMCLKINAIRFDFFYIYIRVHSIKIYSSKYLASELKNLFFVFSKKCYFCCLLFNLFRLISLKYCDMLI